MSPRFADALPAAAMDMRTIEDAEPALAAGGVRALSFDEIDEVAGGVDPFTLGMLVGGGLVLLGGAVAYLVK